MCDLLCLDLPRAEALRRSRPPLSELVSAAEGAKALADPTRLAVAIALRDDGELCVCDLAWVCERSDKLVSHHARLLRAVGLVQSRREHKMVLYALTDRGRQLLRAHTRRRRGGDRVDPAAAPAPLPIAGTSSLPRRSDRWLRAARQARLLAWASLFWMTLEGAMGVLAGIEANSISVLTWAASSAVEGLASAIVIWRFTGHRKLSEHAERRAQRWVAASLLPARPLLPLRGHRPADQRHRGERCPARDRRDRDERRADAAAGLGEAAPGRRLDSGATAGEGVQNLLCAAQALAAMMALVAASAGVAFIDPVAALAIAGVAAKEGVELWRGEDCDCRTVPGLDARHAGGCRDDCCRS